MCELFNLSGKKGWEKRCKKTQSDYGKTIQGIEINCNVLCRIGQGGNACSCA